ncbi:polyprenol monophosphomannose synthase [Flavicella sp.]|uniref:polyprenol monophosphomannose synthase n=1 Tax=Flavicella sp. TaxID=2957742 RepID=UPI002611D890|nr:polyprenol monophosphomannose synthase [Flavicella sp.]MDG1805226.1 polyprenol monophosphomannose synthase [Flavicella sp.]
MSDTIVIIPTLNEIENIKEIISAVFSDDKKFHILVVDDNSQDGTPEMVEELMQEFPERLFLEKRKGKKGLGSAYIHGFKWALKRSYDYIIEMDADFSHNPKDLIKLYNACVQDGAKLSVGSRYVNNNVNVINWNIKRLLLSYFASKYVQFITNIPLYDTTAGFVCYHRSVLETINLDKIQFVGYAFQIEMKFKTWKHKFPIKEVSIVFTDRTKGTSKMSGSIVTEAIFGVIKLRLKGLS